MKDKIRILIHGLGSNFAGGVESFIINYFRNLDKDKFHFDFICYDKEPAYCHEIVNQGSNIYFISGRRKNYFLCCKQLENIYNENEYDVVWSNACSLSDILVIKFAYKNKVKKRIIHAHNNNIKPKQILTKILHNINKRKIIKYSTDFWACSQSAGYFMYPDNVMRSPKFKIIYNAIEAKKFSFDKNSRLRKRKELNLEGKIVFGHIGRFHYQKNHEYLIKIFIEIYKKNQQAVLVLIGDGELRSSIEKIVERNNLTDIVRFLSKREDIPDLLNAMDAFIFPSNYEGLGIVLIEAQASGLQCFVSDIIPQEAIVTDEVYKFSLDETPISWAEKIIKNLNNERKNNYSYIREKGYDIKNETILLEKYFSED